MTKRPVNASDGLLAAAGNGTDLDQIHSPYPPWALAIIWLVAISLVLETVLGNFMVLVAYRLSTNIRKQMSNQFIVSLAVSDMIIGLEGFPFFTIFVANGERWPLGSIACQTWLFLDYSLCLVSIFTVLLITIDRFISVCHAPSYMKWQTANRIKVQIALSWIVPGVIFGIMIYGWEAMTGETVDPSYCYAPFLNNQWVNMAMYFSYYWSTLVAMLILYTGIHKASKKLTEKGEAREKRTVALLMGQRMTAQVGIKLFMHEDDMGTTTQQPTDSAYKSCSYEPLSNGKLHAGGKTLTPSDAKDCPEKKEIKADNATECILVRLSSSDEIEDDEKISEDRTIAKEQEGVHNVMDGSEKTPDSEQNEHQKRPNRSTTETNNPTQGNYNYKTEMQPIEMLSRLETMEKIPKSQSAANIYINNYNLPCKTLLYQKRNPLKQSKVSLDYYGDSCSLISAFADESLSSILTLAGASAASDNSENNSLQYQTKSMQRAGSSLKKQSTTSTSRPSTATSIWSPKHYSNPPNSAATMAMTSSVYSRHGSTKLHKQLTGVHRGSSSKRAASVKGQSETIRSTSQPQSLAQIQANPGNFHVTGMKHTTTTESIHKRRRRKDWPANLQQDSIEEAPTNPDHTHSNTPRASASLAQKESYLEAESETNGGENKSTTQSQRRQANTTPPLHADASGPSSTGGVPRSTSKQSSAGGGCSSRGSVASAAPRYNKNRSRAQSRADRGSATAPRSNNSTNRSGSSSVRTRRERRTASTRTMTRPMGSMIAKMRGRRSLEAAKTHPSPRRVTSPKEGGTKSNLLKTVFHPINVLRGGRKATRAERRARKAFRTITFIVGSFAALWSPYFIAATVYGFCAACVPNALFIICYYLCYLNSSGNPFMYALANRQFKSAFLRMLKGNFREC